MPPLVAAFAVWAGISVAMAYVVVATVVLSAGMAVYGSAQARRAERNARDAANAAMKDRMVTRIATEAPHRYIYGRAKVGADIVAMFTSGSKDQFKHLVCVHAAHECDAIEAVYVNNALVDSLDSSGDPTAGRFAVNPDSDIVEESATGPTFTLSQTPRNGSVWVFSGTGADMQQVAVTGVNGKTVTTTYTGPVTVSYEIAIRRKISDIISEAMAPSATNPVVRIQKHLGGASDVADAYLRSVIPDKWPDTAVLRGLCYTIITLDLNHPEFQGGLVPIHAVIRGRKLYDPRTGLKAWSQNPALAVMDYLTSPLCAVPMTDLPTAQFIAAANVCDENIVGLGARYTINGTVTSDQGQPSVLEAMAQAMAGSLVSTTWDIYAGKYIAPVAALTQEDIVGGLSVTPGASDASVYNGVKGQYISPENKHVQTDFKPYQNSAYRASDGRDLYTNIDFAFTDSLQRVTNLARIFTEDQRNGFELKAEFSLKAWPRKVGERITFTSPTLGQTAKVYRITDKSYSPNSAVQLTLKEDAASIWDFADAVVVDDTPNSDLPDPWEIAPLASITCESGTDMLLLQSDGTVVSRILAKWPAATTQAVFANGAIEIEFRQIGTEAWSAIALPGSELQTYLSPVNDGAFYVVRARCVNPYLNVKSDWLYETHKVIGKTEPPPPVDRFKLIEQPGGIKQFFWSIDNPPADLFSFEVRYSLGVAIRPWDELITLFAKDREARQHETTEPRNDEAYTFAIRCADTTGLLSDPVYITEVLDGDAFGTVLKIVLPHEESWPGQRTDCILTGSALSDVGLLTWDSLDIAWDATDEVWANTPASPITYEHTVIDLGSSLAVIVRANSLSAGVTTTQISTSTDGASYSAWGDAPASTVTARYFKFKWSVSGASPTLYRAQVIFYT